jgi:hypothetical protein
MRRLWATEARERALIRLHTGGVLLTLRDHVLVSIVTDQVALANMLE